MKIAKFDSYHLSQNTKTSSQMLELISRFEAAKTRHELTSQKNLAAMRKHGFQYDVLSLDELKNPITDYDLVVCLGGDGTFLTAAHYILGDTPIMGINTDSIRSFCHFSSYDARTYIIDPEYIWEKMKDGDYEILKRTRLQLSFFDDTQENSKPTIWKDNYALNEVLFADTNVGNATSFRLSVDGKPYLPYKSSGVIFSTGSGSTGWIKSIVNVEPDIVKDIVWERDKLAISDREAKLVSQTIKKKYLLPSEGKNMFYVVREAILQTESDLKKPFKGTATEIIVQSAVKSGVICIDSNIQRKIGFGDRFKIEPAPKQLNCIQLTF